MKKARRETRLRVQRAHAAVSQPGGGGKMLVTSSLSPLGRESRGLLSSSGISGHQVQRACSHCSSAVPEKKEISTQTTRKHPPGVGQFRDRVGALYWQHAILRSWKWGARGVMCMGECARSKIKLNAQASPNPVPTATGPWDGRLCTQGRPGLPAPLSRDFK